MNWQKKLMINARITSYNVCYTKLLRSDYKNYLYYKEKNDIEKARAYYFNALYNAFNMFSGDTIMTFKEDEDKYIETLLEMRSNILKEMYKNKYGF